MKQYAGAVEDFGALESHPTLWPLALTNRAVARAGQGEVQGAIDDLERAEQAGTTPTRLFFLRARYRRQQGDLEGAARDEAEGLRREPTDPLSFVARGVARIGTSAGDALADFQQALVLDPGCRPALQNAAHVLAERLGRPADSVAYLTRLADLAPEAAEPLASRGVVLARLGRMEAAIRDAEQALQRHPSALTTLQIACIFALVGDRDDTVRDRALALVGRSLRAAPKLYAIAAVDPDLTTLRDDERFKQLLAASRQLCGK